MPLEFKPGVSLRRTAVAALVGGLVAQLMLLAASLPAQPEVIMENFVVPLEYYPAPNESQPKCQLEGSKAEPQSGGLTMVMDGKLKNFATNGVLTMMAETSRCVFDARQRIVTSDAPLHVSTADNSFSLVGQGFSFTQSNSVLTISNQVRTVIRNRFGRRSFRP